MMFIILLAVLKGHKIMCVKNAALKSHLRKVWHDATQCRHYLFIVGGQLIKKF